jgi:uncharacterized repeat protein (TIGR03803 family)
MKRLSMPATRKRILVFALMLALGAFTTGRAKAQSYSVLYSFTGGASDGGNPLAGLVMDAAGNLYGTVSNGGSSFNGAVFKMSQSNGVWTETVLYSFGGGTDGATPEASLLMDSAGNLYGTTYAGGAHGLGTVFKLSHPNGVWKEIVLHSFAGGAADGANPQADLIMDREGNLYGTTCAGGAYAAGAGSTCGVSGVSTSGGGTVFELSKKGNETVLHSFGAGTDGANPWAGVTMDAKGNLYGTTSAGGADTFGTVFQLMPLPESILSTPPKYKENILYSFAEQSDGGVPYAGVAFDGAGNLYGAATAGGVFGGVTGGGTIFELTPSNGSWKFNLLYQLAGYGISGPYQNFVLDASGNIYSTTHCDGANSDGSVIKLTPSNGAWTYTDLYDFVGYPNAYFSFSNLVFDKLGNLYGTTRYGGGEYNNGVVFELTP